MPGETPAHRTRSASSRSSDRASRGGYPDKGGPGIVAALEAMLATPWRPVSRIVPDEREAIEATLIDLADVQGCTLVLTTGGTGPAPAMSPRRRRRRSAPA